MAAEIITDLSEATTPTGQSLMPQDLEITNHILADIVDALINEFNENETASINEVCIYVA